MNFYNSSSNGLTEQTAAIVAAYVSNNHVAFAELPAMIMSVHNSLVKMTAAPDLPATPEKFIPAVPIRKSVTDDFIICLEDGRQFKSLKRHLSSKFGMTPQEYRAKWGLPNDYPMVAPGYSAKRSALALSLGLGRKPAVALEPEAQDKPVRGRKAKAAKVKEG